MILPISTYGDNVLRKTALPIKEKTEKIDNLISDMFETLLRAGGVGLAAPQIGEQLQLFIIINGDFEEVFINAEIIEYSADKQSSQEGCLSVPDIYEYVDRSNTIKIKYLDAEFKEQIREFEGMNAIIIQHEYDHTKGVIFTDKLSPIKKKLLRSKLEKIRKNKVHTDYRVR